MRVGRRIAIGGLVIALATGPLPALAAADSPGAQPKAGPARTAVLPTGDRVTVTGGARPAVSISPAAGREHVMFHRYRTRNHSYVVPQDVIRRIGTGQVDRQRFDVTPLFEPHARAAGRTPVPPRAPARASTSRSTCAT